jgi:hypothetical protein
MQSEHNKPLLNKRIFWDINPDVINYDLKAAFIIERIFERGDVEDIRQCRRYYGDALVKNTLLNAKYLSEARLYLASAIINEPLNAFRCYLLKQSNPELFPY